MQNHYQLLEDVVYEKIWAELSGKDRLIAYGIAKSQNGKRGEVNEYLHLKPNEINQYRKRLIKKGIISGEEYGRMHFALPLFEQFVIEKTNEPYIAKNPSRRSGGTPLPPTYTPKGLRVHPPFLFFCFFCISLVYKYTGLQPGKGKR